MAQTGRRAEVDLGHDLAHLAAMEVNIHEARTHLSRLLERVALGEEVILAKAEKPVARLVAIKCGQAERPLGLAKAQIVIADDFDAPLPADIEEDFYR